MSVVARPLVLSNNSTTLNGHLPNGSGSGKPFGTSTAASSSSLLKDMLASKMEFGEPVGKNAMNLGSGVREILPGPRSPKANGYASLPNGLANGKKQDVAESSSGEEEEEQVEEERKGGVAGPSTSNGSATKMIGPVLPTHLATPTRKDKGKGKEAAPSSSSPATSSNTSTPRVGGAGVTRSLHEDPIELSWPPDLQARKKVSAAGLYNPSMACYANATLQVLLHTPPVLRIAQLHDEKNCRQAANKGWCMLCALKKLGHGEHWSGSKAAYRPREVHEHLSKIKKGFSKNRQEDTHEFFRFVTDALQNTALCGTPKDLPAKIKHTTWVYQTWGGEVRSRVVCSKCRKPSDTFDNFLDLSLDVPKNGQKSVKTMLQNFIREDRLEGDNKYHCENCKAKANATKSFRILHAPPVLTLHLKRFAVTYGWNGKPRANKNTNFIEYPESLDIAPYMVDSKSTGTQYRLFGVTCHRGQELRFGHYTSYVRGPHGSWYHADDEDMTSVSTSQVLKESSAYLLSYIRVGDHDTITATQQPTSAKSSPLRANGHANGHTPSAASSPPQKRKRQWTNRESDDDDDPLTPLKPKSKHEVSSPAYNPSDDEAETAASPRKWSYEGNGNGSKKKHRPNMPAPRASIPELNTDSPIRRPSHPSPGGGSRAERRLKRKQMRKGAPQPFNVGASSTANGGKNGSTSASAFRRGDRQPMQPRKRKDNGNGRRSFRG